jgi:hypothetical protein
VRTVFSLFPSLAAPALPQSLAFVNCPCKEASFRLPYLLMRRALLCGFLIVFGADWGASQTIDVGPKPSNLPMYRPILIGKGPSALIDRIDADGLVKKGQKNAVIMFSCLVERNGQVSEGETYRGTPGSELLEQELRAKLKDSLFVPGIYDHVPVDAIYYGTVTFVVIDGKPRLRIFSNQETKEVEKETDFIGPQPFFGDGSKFTGLHYPDTAVQINGIADLHMKIDQAGNLQVLSLAAEYPPLAGFGPAAFHDFDGAKFIPAFRKGKPVACDITLPVCYEAPGF